MLNYGEFCIEPLDDDMERGRYRVKTNWTLEEKDEVEKEHDYYSVVLCISIVCLSVTIIIYVVFREGLLKLMYNKIMINFAGSLLLAFLSLVVMQNLEVEEQTRSTCIGLALLNQFAFLSAFSLMTLMSYNIFAQLHNMRVGSGTSSGLLKVALCYIVPGLITLVTLVVELTAPRCAAVRPKFGTKYNFFLLFFGSSTIMPLDYFLEKSFLSGAATFTEEWTSLSGSTFRSLFSSSSTPACSSTL